MLRLIKIEWRKIYTNRIFWATFAAYILTYIAILLVIRNIIGNINDNMAQASGGMKVLPDEIYKFPFVFHNLAFLSKYIKVFLGLVAVLLVTNEYTYNTLKQNIITGITKMEVMISKMIDIVFLALVSTILIFVFGLVAGFITSSDYEISEIFERMVFLPSYFLLVLNYLAFTMMLGIILRKAVLALGVLLVYSYILEPILSWKFGDSFGEYLPLNQASNLVMAPKNMLFTMLKVNTTSNTVELQSVIISTLYIALFFGISYYILKRRDL